MLLRLVKASIFAGVLAAVGLDARVRVEVRLQAAQLGARKGAPLVIAAIGLGARVRAGVLLQVARRSAGTGTPLVLALRLL